MDGLKLDKLKEATNGLLSTLPEYNRVTLISYSDDAEVVFSLASIVEKDALKRKVKRMDAIGKTNIGTGLEIALSELENTTNEEKKYILLLTDGLITTGLTTTEIIELASSHIDVSISTVSVGTEPDKEFLRALADSANGRFYDVENAIEMVSSFTKEVGEIVALEELVTYVYLLNVRETLDTIDKDATTESILRGFNGEYFITEQGKSSVFFNLICVNSLRRLGTLDSLEKEKLIGWVKTQRLEDGGYAEIGQSHSTAFATASALSLLNYLDATIESEEESRTFMLDHATGGGFENTKGEGASLLVTNAVVETLYEFDALSGGVLNGAADFALSTELESGGFADRVGGTEAHPWFSRLAVEIISRADRLDEIDKNRLEGFLTFVKNPDGYAYTPGGETTVGATYDAERILKMISTEA